jgi:ribonuclease P protein component
MRFPCARRITRRSDFQRVRREGRSYRGRHMILGVLADSEIRSLKVGYITTRRLGNAVLRSGIRRRLRGVVQRHGLRLKSGHWLVMIPHTLSGAAGSADLERDWLKLARKAGLLEEESTQNKEAPQ